MSLEKRLYKESEKTKHVAQYELQPRAIFTPLKKTYACLQKGLSSLNEQVLPWLQSPFK
eukprot:c31035_g1_i1 orf=2-175(-)